MSGVSKPLVEPSPRLLEFLAIQLCADLARLNRSGLGVILVEHVQMNHPFRTKQQVQLVVSHISINETTYQKSAERSVVRKSESVVCESRLLTHRHRIRILTA